MSGFDVKIENVVVFATLGKRLPLDVVSTGLAGAEYAPESFPGVVYRIDEPRTAALIFSSGKIVCTGANSVENAMNAVNRVVEDVRKLGIDLPQEFETRVENMVASTKIDASLQLEDVAFMLENSEYEPEQFPGLVYRLPEPRVAFLLFGTGKIICTGGRNLEDINAALVKFRERLEGIGVNFRAS